MSRFTNLPIEVCLHISEMLDWSGILGFMGAIAGTELQVRLEPFLSEIVRRDSEVNSFILASDPQIGIELEYLDGFQDGNPVQPTKHTVNLERVQFVRTLTELPASRFQMSISSETLLTHRKAQDNRTRIPTRSGSLPRELNGLVVSFHREGSDEKLVLPFSKPKGQCVQPPFEDMPGDGCLIRTICQELRMVGAGHRGRPAIILPSTQKVPVPVAYLRCFQHVSVSTIFCQEGRVLLPRRTRIRGVRLLCIAVSFDNLELPSSDKHRRLISNILPSRVG
jgi:hypothetical protein